MDASLGVSSTPFLLPRIPNFINRPRRCVIASVLYKVGRPRPFTAISIDEHVGQVTDPHPLRDLLLVLLGGSIPDACDPSTQLHVAGWESFSNPRDVQ